MRSIQDTDVFTTGQVAKICRVSINTVMKWFDSGLLNGYRIPATRDRRIPRENLVQFLKRHKMPLWELSSEEKGELEDVTQIGRLPELPQNGKRGKHPT